MRGNHLVKKQQYKSIYIFVMLLFIIFLSLMACVVSGITQSYGDNHSPDTVIYNDTPNPDMNYGTKEYWDVYYGERTEDQYITNLSPGQTLGSEGKTMDYFIAKDLTVAGDPSKDNPSGIIIKGNVNIYFEAIDNQTPGPTLTVSGGRTTGKKGAGAGIELLTGAKLYVTGRGYLNVTGGNIEWNPADHPGKDGKYPMEGGSHYDSGSGGHGGDGSGGAGAAIGTRGGAGGAGGKEGTYAHYNGDREGNDAKGGSSGDDSSSSGLFLISGNVVTSLTKGKANVKKTTVTRSSGREWRQTVYQPFALSVNGGGGGGYGGVGWNASAVGSGGAGAGGGGGGGAGSNVWEGATSSFAKGSGGGGGGGNSSVALKNSGGGVWNDDDDQDYTSPSTQGSDCRVINVKDSYTAAGGKGAHGGGQPRSGNGGAGGYGGISGSEGLFKSVFLNSSESFEYDTNYCPGRDSDAILCFPWYELRSNSLVSWCLALPCINSCVDSLQMIHNPTGIQVNRDENNEMSSYYNVKWNEDDTISHFGQNTFHIESNNGETGSPVVTLDDMETGAKFEDTSYEVWLVSKGLLDIQFPDKKTYDGIEVEADNDTKFFFEGQDVKNEIDPENIEYKWFKYEGETLVEMDDGINPKDAGKYRIRVRMKDLQYVGEFEQDYTIETRSASGQPNKYVKRVGQPDPVFECTWDNILEDETLIKGNKGDDPASYDYSVTREEGEVPYYYKISIELSEVGIHIKNYQIKLFDNSLTIKEGKAAKIIVDIPVSITYGEDIPQFSIKCEGLDEGDDLTEDEDYTFIYDYDNKNVGDHTISVEPNYFDSEIAKKYFFEIIPSTLTIKPKTGALIKPKETTSEYSDKTPIIETEQSGFAYDESLVEGEDYSIVFDSSHLDARKHTISIQLNEESKKIKNYANIETKTNILTVTKKHAEVKADDITTMLSWTPPLTITENGLLPGEHLLEGVDYNISCAYVYEAGEYDIVLEIIETGDTAKNYNITATNGKYFVQGDYVTFKLLEFHDVYGNAKSTISDQPLLKVYKSDGTEFKAIPFTPGVDYILHSVNVKDSNAPIGVYDLDLEFTSSGERVLQLLKRQSYYSYIDDDIGKGKYIIDKRPITCTCDDKTSEYGSNDVPLSITVDSGEFSMPTSLRENIDYIIEREPGDNAGDYDITGKTLASNVTDNYSITWKKGTYTIAPAKGLTFTADESTKTYGDKDPIFTCSVTGAKNNDVFGTDTYKLERKDKREIVLETGYEIEVTVNSDMDIFKNYELSAITLIPGKLFIEPFKLINAKINPDYIEPYEYSGEAFCPEFSLEHTFDSGTKKVFVLNTDYTLEYSDNVNAGTCIVTFTGKDNCFEQTYSSFEISKKKGAILKCNNAESVYGDKFADLSADATGLVNSESLKKGDDYTISWAQCAAAGTYTITATIIDDGPIAKNYYWNPKVATGTYTIDKFSDFQNAIINGDFSEEHYTGGNIEKSFTVSYTFADSGTTKQFVKDDDYIVTYSDNKNAGTCKVKISGTGSCDSSSFALKEFVITKLNASATLDNKEIVYGQELTYSLVTTGVIEGETLKYNQDFVITGGSEDVGEYTIVASIIPTGPVARNYIFAEIPSASLNVSPFNFKNVNVNPIAPIVYTGSEIRPSFLASYTFLEMKNRLVPNNTKVFDEGKDYYVTYENNINVGTATATLHGHNNCENEKQVKFQIVEPTPDAPIFVNGTTATGDNLLVAIVSFCVLLCTSCLIIYLRRKIS